MIWRELLFPLGWGYQWATGFRNLCYDWRIFRAHKADAKVISIGNLTVGGTGKTPVTLAIIEKLIESGHSCGVISRGYKRALKGVHEVDTSAKAPQLYGDEPALIKATFPKVPVFVGDKRIAAAKALLEKHKVDILICDDAFQHRALHRDLNIVLMDATESSKNYRVLPVGVGREKMDKALRRADLVIVTKANLAGAEKTAEVVAKIRLKHGMPIVLADYEVIGFHSLEGVKRAELNEKVYLVSAIAKPEAFEKTLEGRVKIVKHKTFNDHFKYSDLEIETILDETSQLQARWILTTQKDAVKMKAFSRLRERLWIADLGLKFRDGKKELYEAIDRLARSRA